MKIIIEEGLEMQTRVKGGIRVISQVLLTLMKNLRLQSTCRIKIAIGIKFIDLL